VRTTRCANLGEAFGLQQPLPSGKHSLMQDGMQSIRSKRGMLAKVAHGLGLTRAAVVKWDRVPAERVPEVESITGIPRHELRPDLWQPSPSADAA
jgi:hypothetical protein